MKITKTQLTVSHPIRVRFNETDSLGIVWHGNYLSYFEEGREAFGRQYDLTYLDIQNKGFAVPIVESSLSHKKPLRYGDVATIETTFLDCKAAKLMFNYTIFNASKEVVCTGKTTQVFTRTSNGELALLVPQFLTQWKKKVGLLHG
ncbi:MAG: acyl-CoA thioesterase [Flavobacteriales bacterium]|jgi:acyl-CoA thioester hydrolase|nr:acyl-CoA thioesterase [Flavobacteriales bacterium]